MQYIVNDNIKVRIYITRRTAKNGKPFNEYLICKVFDFNCKLEHGRCGLFK